MAKLIFTESATQFILDAFGIFTDRLGRLHDEFGEIIRFDEGDPVTIKNFVGIKKGENGEVIFIRMNSEQEVQECDATKAK